MYSDAHIHPYDLHHFTGDESTLGKDLCICTSSHEKVEFLWHETYALRYPGQVYHSFGIHPQLPDADTLPFLESLIAEKRIHAIGECGFDLFTGEYKERIREQTAVWKFQLEIAVFSGLPLVIHCRNAMNLIFADIQLLKKVRAVVFHGWSGSLVEARSLLARGVNSYFSAGKGLLRGNRSLGETVALIPRAHLLTETDAPYMPLKGESFSSCRDIVRVVDQAAILRNENAAELSTQVYRNFIAVFANQPVSQ